MPRFTGTISRDGQVIWEEVRGSIARRQQGGITGYEGSFVVYGAKKEPLRPGGPFRLDTDDGFSIHVIIGRTDGRDSAEFLSTGEVIRGELR